MLSPIQAMRSASDAPSLPRVDELMALYGYGFIPRRGQLLLIAGESGALKSFFLQWYCSRLDLPTLYFSADNDAHTSITRLAAQRSGYPVDAVAEAMDAGGAALFEDHLFESKIQFCFDSSPTLEDIADEIAAYVELWDRYPEVIAIDNLINVEAYSDDEWAGLRQIMKELHRMARETGSAVVVLHHCQEQGRPFEPPPKRALMGKVHQLPERILTVAYNPTESCLLLAPVKNRGGKCDPSGRLFVRISAYPERASFGQWVGLVRMGGGYDDEA